MRRPPTSTALVLLALATWSGVAIAEARQASDEIVAPSPAPSPAADPGARRKAIDDANAAMRAEDWAAAAEAWGRLEAIAPNLADAAYNRGVARYRAGDFGGAAESFQRAARLGDADLSARSMYNEGTARYAEAVRALDAGEVPTSPDDPEAPDPLQQAIERVGRSLDHFRDAIDADPTSLDARANAELAHRLLRRLEEVREQQQSGEGDESQEPSQDGDQQQEPQEQQGDGDQQQSQDQQQQQQQSGEDEQEQPSPRQQGEGDQEAPEQPQESDGEGEGEESQDDASEGEMKESPEDAPEPGGTAENAESAAGSGQETEAEESPQRMSREAAERLLQSVRDKERQRRRQKAREESRGPRQPVERDW